MASPITGQTTYSSASSFDLFYAYLNTLGSGLEQFVIGRFASDAARDNAITSPKRGQVCWVDSPGVGQVYSGTAWRQIFPLATAVTKRTYAQRQITGGPQPYDLAQESFNLPYPYLVVAVASVKGSGLTGAAALWINQAGASGGVTWANAEIVGDFTGVGCTAIIPMPSGGALTVKSTVNMGVNSSLFIYTDQTHSHLQTLVMPLGMSIA